MASKRPVQVFATIRRPARRRITCSTLSLCSRTRPFYRALSTSSGEQEVDGEAALRPRWQYTPPAMKAPVRLRGYPNQPEFKVNSDPATLDRFYVRMLGNGGDKMLSEEVKWQSVTHKSFDQGRRGFNDRLAFLGMDDGT